MKYFLILFSVGFLTFSGFTQNDPFQIYLEPIAIEQLPGIQSYAVGQHEGQWLIIGGRIDGLHRRQPWATFNPDGRNVVLTVIDPQMKKIWTSPLTSLSLPLQDQLSSTNMEFYQAGDFLYLIGGYGHSETIGSKLTFAMFTAVDVPQAIAAIKNGDSFTPYFRTLTDTQFAVAGGQLGKIGDTYFLAGGHNFDGNYNPMNHATFTQEYTNAIRRFQLLDDGTKIEITHLSPWMDTAAFHRRDYNMGEVIRPDGSEGLVNFSGPFQVTADLPYLNITTIDENGYETIPAFAQYYNNYHCARLPLYSAETKEMHTIFFGGIAQYYVENGELVQDNDVPFVKTIARVTQDASGQFTEYKLPVEMPAYLGAGAEFIILPEIPTYANGVVRLDALAADTIQVGYIFGGIESSANNIFWDNEGTLSVAHDLVYKVYIVQHSTTSLDEANAHSNNGLQVQIYPNPNEGIFTINFFLEQVVPVHLTITDAKGKEVLQEDLSNEVAVGKNKVEKNVKSFKVGGVYFITLTVGDKIATQKILVKP